MHIDHTRHHQRFISHSGKPVLLLLTLIFTVASLTSLHAQQLSRYQGRYILRDSLVGIADFQYRLQQDDTIKDGRFIFRHFVEHYLETDSIHGLVLDGNFRNGLKHGPWKYASRQYAVAGEAQTIEGRIVYDASGTEWLINANFREGRAHGDYELVVRRIAESNPTDTSFYSKAQYQNGQITGRLIGFTPKLHVEGQFDEEGFPNGDWVFTHRTGNGSPIQELRRYDHGFFSKHYYKMGDRLLEIKHIGFDTLAKSGRGLLTRFPATRAYFRALGYTNVAMDTTAISGVISIDSSQRYISRANEFLERVFIQPAGYRDSNVWLGAGGSDPVPPIRVKVSEFSFSEAEAHLNQNNERLLSEVQSLIDDFFDNPNTQLGRFTNEQLSRFYGVLRIYRDRVGRIAPVIQFLADEASEYVDHDAILAHNAIDIRYPDKLVYEFQDEKLTDTHPFPPALTAFNAHSLNRHLTAVFDDVSAIISRAESTLGGYQAQSDLKDNERQLVSLRDSVIRKFSNAEQRQDYNRLHGEMRDSVHRFIDISFKEYAALQVYRRLLAVDSLQVCYTDYLQLYDTLVGYYDRLEQLDRQYTRSIWNPYTFTYMDERIKERLYRAFEETVFPYVWERARRQLSCDSLPIRLNDLKQLLDRMAELRLEDTKALENNLRRSRNDVHKCLELMGLHLDGAPATELKTKI
ncbi:hypothetical protein ACFOET_00825 [Parapedobacter deserti]|uniref:Uncharacterized protein n=1 Tax=Parapedobacter deserti TaxID=1912957 RepID=A0ABV7JDF1_9SPHI